MTPKISSFKVFRAPGGKVEPEIDVIFVHGFQNPKKSILRERFEQYFKDAARESMKVTYRASFFAFDASDILSKGFDELKKISDKLVTKTKLLEVSNDEYQYDKKKKKKKKKNKDEENGDSKAANLRILFVAHGLGPWVVQHALARYECLRLSFAIVGMVFVDHPDSKLGSPAYSQYLDVLFEEITPKSPYQEKVVTELGKRLHEVHENWRRTQTSEYRDHVHEYQIWSINSGIDVPNRDISTKRFHRLRRRLRRISHAPTEGSELSRIFHDIGFSSPESRGNDLHRNFRNINTESQAVPHIDTVRNVPDLQSETTRPQSAPTELDEMEVPDQAEQPLSRVTSQTSSTTSITAKSPPDLQLPAARFNYLESHNTSSERGSISSRPYDELKVAKILPDEVLLADEDKAEFKRSADLARSYLQRGNLDNAYTFYQRCNVLLKRNSDVENTFAQLTVHIQIGITLLQQGKYKEATKQLKATKKVIYSQRKTKKLFQNVELLDLDWWLAVSLLRRGEYKKAKEGLEQLVPSKTLENQQNITEQEPSWMVGLTEEQRTVHLAKIRGTLALANGYMGEYTEAFRQTSLVSNSIEALHLPESRSKSGQEVQHKTPPKKHDSVIPQRVDPSPHIINAQHNLLYTEGIIYMLYGDYAEALTKAESAHAGFVKQWGRKHFRTLEIASLVAILLAYNSKTKEAYSLCQTSLDVLTASVGHFHPLTLQALEILVYIFRNQARFTEAVDTCSSLCKRIEASLGAKHPQTLRAKTQLATANFSCGNYFTTGTIMAEVVQTAQELFRDEHPDTLRFKSYLAQAYCYAWKIDSAESLIRDVIPGQRIIYTLAGEKTREKTQSTEIFNNNMLQILLADVSRDSETLRVHPDLLFSLQLLAKIESRKPAPDLNLVKKIHQTVWHTRKQKLHPGHALTLISEFELATTYREKQDMSTALQMFQHVATERAKLLGAQHPDTLSARHESLLLIYILEQIINVKELKLILKLREWQLGPDHPDTHDSLLWIFAVQLFQENNKEAYQTAERLLNGLNTKFVRHERIIDSLKVAQKIASFYQNQNHNWRSALIFRQILTTMNDHDLTLHPPSEILNFKLGISQSLDLVREKVVSECEQLTTDARAAFQRGNRPVGKNCVQQAYERYEAIEWEKNDEEGVVQWDLAKVMWDGGRREEAFGILRGVWRDGAGMGGVELRGLGDVYHEWARELKGGDDGVEGVGV